MDSDLQTQFDRGNGTPKTTNQLKPQGNEDDPLLENRNLRIIQNGNKVIRIGRLELAFMDGWIKVSMLPEKSWQTEETEAELLSPEHKERLTAFLSR
jgi:hypothetical protein